MSVEEDRRAEPESPVKREYLGSFVYPLHRRTGVSDAHDTTVGNVFATLRTLARRAGCYAYTSDRRVSSSDRFTYSSPDTTVTCEPRQDDAQFRVAPHILVEVPSKSTAHNEHNGNCHAYTALPSLQTYLIAEQTDRRVYVCQREGERWTVTEDVESSLTPLPCLNTSVSLHDSYDGVP